MIGSGWVARARAQAVVGPAAAFGWDAHGALVVGDRRYAGGEVQRAHIDGQLAPLVRHFPVVGTVQGWARAVKSLVEAGLWPVGWTVLLSLACPLWRYTRLHGATWCWTGGAGRGKTLALVAGASVWGDPEGLFVAPRSSEVAMLSRLADSGSLPVWVDEAQLMERGQLRRVVHQVAEGLDAERMTAEGAIIVGRVWHTLLVCSARRRLPPWEEEGTGDRMYQTPVDSVETVDPERRLADMVALEENAGAMGDAWAAYLTRHRETLPALLAQWRPMARARLAEAGWAVGGVRERYRAAMLEVAWCAGRLARHAGLLDLDPDRLLEKVAAQRLMADPEPVGAHPLRLLSEYLREHPDRFVTMGLHPRVTEGRWEAFDPGRVARLKALVARLEVVWPEEAPLRWGGRYTVALDAGQSAHLYVGRRPFERWLSRRQASIEAVEGYLRSQDALLHEADTANLGAGIRLPLRRVRASLKIDLRALPALLLSLPAGAMDVDLPKVRKRTRRRDRRASRTPPAATTPTAPGPAAACPPPSSPG